MARGQWQAASPGSAWHPSSRFSSQSSADPRLIALTFAQDHDAPCVASRTPCSSLTPPAQPLLAKLKLPTFSTDEADEVLIKVASPLEPLILTEASAAKQPHDVSLGISPLSVALLVFAALIVGFAGGATLIQRQVNQQRKAGYHDFGVYQRACAALGDTA
eukprot:scaffold218615_cov30-Tisochrysis_lutea.AAC.2